MAARSRGRRKAGADCHTKGNCEALCESSVSKVFWGRGAVEVVPFFDGLLGRHAVPEFGQVARNDEAALRAAMALENAAPDVIPGEFCFYKRRLV
jgi:hypothetical protein